MLKLIEKDLISSAKDVVGDNLEDALMEALHDIGFKFAHTDSGFQGGVEMGVELGELAKERGHHVFAFLSEFSWFIVARDERDMRDRLAKAVVDVAFR